MQSGQTNTSNKSNKQHSSQPSAQPSISYQQQHESSISPYGLVHNQSVPVWNYNNNHQIMASPHFTNPQTFNHSTPVYNLPPQQTPSTSQFVGNEQFSAMMERFDKLENKLSQLDSIKTSVDKITVRLDKLDSRVISLETKLAEIENSREYDSRNIDEIRKKTKRC